MQNSEIVNLNLQARQRAAWCLQQPFLSAVVAVMLLALTTAVLVIVAMLVCVVCVVMLVAIVVVELVSDAVATPKLAFPNDGGIGLPLHPTNCEFQVSWQNCSRVIPASQANRSAGCPWQSFGLCLTAVKNTCFWSCTASPDPELVATTRRPAAIHIPITTRPRRRKGMPVYGCITSGQSESESCWAKGESASQAHRPLLAGEVRKPRVAPSGESVPTRHHLAMA
mmetsp:Transcript_112566/g.223757  ORF Transcript_112566/g.223757 Transcript_112566/m.223757 type:complete len:225 (+) Transcript_112566:1806-2480(+)